MKSRQKSSSHDMTRDMKYLSNVTVSNRDTAEIVRDKDDHVKIIRNGVVTYDSRKR